MIESKNYTPIKEIDKLDYPTIRQYKTTLQTKGNLSCYDIDRRRIVLEGIRIKKKSIMPGQHYNSVYIQLIISPAMFENHPLTFGLWFYNSGNDESIDVWFKFDNRKMLCVERFDLDNDTESSLFPVHKTVFAFFKNLISKPTSTVSSRKDTVLLHLHNRCYDTGLKYTASILRHTFPCIVHCAMLGRGVIESHNEHKKIFILIINYWQRTELIEPHKKIGTDNDIQTETVDALDHMMCNYCCHP